MNQFYIEFFELTFLLNKEFNEDVKAELHKKLLKLNNPTYYNKYVITNPINLHGFSSKIIKNPVLIAIKSMLNYINNSVDNLKVKLQTELSWAYNNYTSYTNSCI